MKARDPLNPGDAAFDKLDEKIRQALMEEGVIIPETIEEVRQAKARLEARPVTVPPHLRNSTAVAATARQEAAEALAKWKQEATDNDIQQYREPYSTTVGTCGSDNERLPDLLLNHLRPAGPVLFPSGEVADSAWEFGSLDGLPSKQAQAIVEIIAERAYRTFPLDLRSRQVVLVCFGEPIHRCGKRLAGMLKERNGVDAHVVLAVNFFEPRFCCAARELRGQNVVLFVDVVHTGGLVDRLAQVCKEAQPVRLLRMAVIDQGDNTKRMEPVQALWREQQEMRIPLKDYLTSSKDNRKSLRFFDPEFARASAKQDLPKEIADRSTASQTIEREIRELRPIICRTNALQADKSLGGLHYPWVIDLPTLLGDSEARDFLVQRTKDLLAELNLQGVWGFVYPAERWQRAGKWVRLLSEAMDWPVVPVGQARRKHFQPLKPDQRKRLSEFDGVVVVDSAIRTGNTLRSFVQLLSSGEKPVVQRVCYLYVFDGLFETDRNALVKELGVTIHSLFRLPLGPPIKPIGQYCRERMRSTLRELDERYPDRRPEWAVMVRNYCEKKLKRPRRRPASGEDSEAKLRSVVDELQRGQQARLERSWNLEKSSILKQLDVEFALREPKTRMMLRGFLSNSMPPDFIEWCALAVVSENEFDWLDTDWLLLHENILSDSKIMRWEFLAYIFYVMKARGNVESVAKARNAIQEFRIRRRTATPLLFPNLDDVVDARCKCLDSILAAPDA